jgi:hypothetical protein
MGGGMGEKIKMYFAEHGVLTVIFADEVVGGSGVIVKVGCRVFFVSVSPMRGIVETTLYKRSMASAKTP